jgi:predicted nucleic-acid-binding Zn-ribbon protein
MMDLKCNKCGSNKVIPLTSVADQGQYSDGTLKAYVYTNPDAWLFKGPVFAKLQARICGECGLTELYAENPQEIYEAYLRVSQAAK